MRALRDDTLCGDRGPDVTSFYPFEPQHHFRSCASAQTLQRARSNSKIVRRPCSLLQFLELLQHFGDLDKGGVSTESWNCFLNDLFHSLNSTPLQRVLVTEAEAGEQLKHNLKKKNATANRDYLWLHVKRELGRWGKLEVFEDENNWDVEEEGQPTTSLYQRICIQIYIFLFF